MYPHVLALMTLFAQPPQVPKPKIKLSVNGDPKAGVSGFAPLTVRAQAVLHDPGREFSCPEVEFIWGDGCRSAEVADCDPYAQEDVRPDRWAPLARLHVYHGPGSFSLIVRIKGSAEMEVAAWRVIEVKGRFSEP